jgi:mono/diheme cytochrome c family protein
MYSLCPKTKMQNIFSIRIMKIGTLLALAVTALNFSSAQSTSSIRDGIFSDVQAARGAEAYSTSCASCHSVDLRGNSNSPSLLGLSFMFIWEGKSLGELYTKMSTEMPTDRPGILTQQTYTDILAFILKSNEFASGENNLTSDTSILNGIPITSQ